MKKTKLGEFEELVLLTVAVMSGEAYGAAITTDISERTKRPVQQTQATTQKENKKCRCLAAQRQIVERERAPTISHSSQC